MDQDEEEIAGRRRGLTRSGRAYREDESDPGYPTIQALVDSRRDIFSGGASLSCVGKICQFSSPKGSLFIFSDARSQRLGLVQSFAE